VSRCYSWRRNRRSWELKDFLKYFLVVWPVSMILAFAIQYLIYGVVLGQGFVDVWRG
jgi:hypothetical protein